MSENRFNNNEKFWYVDDDKLKCRHSICELNELKYSVDICKGVSNLAERIKIIEC